MGAWVSISREGVLQLGVGYSLITSHLLSVFGLTEDSVNQIAKPGRSFNAPSTISSVPPCPLSLIPTGLSASAVRQFLICREDLFKPVRRDFPGLQCRRLSPCRGGFQVAVRC